MEIGNSITGGHLDIFCRDASNVEMRTCGFPNPRTALALECP